MQTQHLEANIRWHHCTVLQIQVEDSLNHSWVQDTLKVQLLVPPSPQTTTTSQEIQWISNGTSRPGSTPGSTCSCRLPAWADLEETVTDTICISICKCRSFFEKNEVWISCMFLLDATSPISRNLIQRCICSPCSHTTWYNPHRKQKQLWFDHWLMILCSPSSLT